MPNHIANSIQILKKLEQNMLDHVDFNLAFHLFLIGSTGR